MTAQLSALREAREFVKHRPHCIAVNKAVYPSECICDAGSTLEKIDAALASNTPTQDEVERVARALAPKLVGFRNLATQVADELARTALSAMSRPSVVGEIGGWHSIEKDEVPKDGRLYRCKNLADRGFVWWAADQQAYGWVAEGARLEPGNILFWTEFE